MSPSEPQTPRVSIDDVLAVCKGLLPGVRWTRARRRRPWYAPTLHARVPHVGHIDVVLPTPDRRSVVLSGAVRIHVGERVLEKEVVFAKTTGGTLSRYRIALQALLVREANESARRVSAIRAAFDSPPTPPPPTLRLVEDDAPSSPPEDAG